MSAPELADIEFDVLNVRNADRVMSMIFDELISGGSRDSPMASIVREKCPDLADREIFVMDEDHHSALIYSVFHLSEMIRELYTRYHGLLGSDGPKEGGAS